MAWWNRRPKARSASPLTAPAMYQPHPVLQPRRGAPLVTEAAMMGLPPFYAAMKVCATQLAGLPIVDAAGEPIDTDPETGTHLLARPTAHDTCFTFLDSIMWNMMIHGNAFVVPTEVSYATGEITRFEVVHPDNVVPWWPRFGSSASYEVGIRLDGEDLGPQDFVHLKDLSVGGYGFGFGRLKLLAHAVGIQLSEAAHVKSTYDDGAMPTGYWKVGKVRDSDTLVEYAKELADQFGGRGNSVGALPDGTAWEAVSLNHRDIQLLEARQWSTAQAASIMGVPPHLIGGAEYNSETYSNARMDMAAFEELTLKRFKRTISEAFALHGVRFGFGASKLAQPDATEMIQALVAAVGAGICSAEQAAEQLGWPTPDPEPEPEPEPGPDPDPDPVDEGLRKMLEQADA